MAALRTQITKVQNELGLKQPNRLNETEIRQ